MSKQQRAEIDRMLRTSPLADGQSMTETRTAYAAFTSTMYVPSEILTHETELGGIRALLVQPTGKTKPGTILFFHGGGYVLGSPETDLCLTGGLVVRTGLRAYSLAYRLAPEYPFPAAQEDGLAAYQSLLDTGTDPASITFAGDSAGGGLTITTLLRARQAGLPMPAAVVTFSAGLDSTRTGKSMQSKKGIDPILSPDSLAATGLLYLAGADPNQELLSPATLADPTGFPPLLLQSGTNEVLLDDSVRMANRARDAGVDVILDITADVPHVFQAFAGRLDEADQALDRAGLFLTQHMSSA
jgi:monoterpene epsilon-lactone hydrolase